MNTSCKLTEVTFVKEWQVDEYNIRLSRYLGPVGPSFCQHKVYKNGHFINVGNLFSEDTCVLHFDENRERYVYLNLCNTTKKVLTDTRVQLNIAAVDSMAIRGNNTIPARRLSRREMKKYTKTWNTAQANGYGRLEKKKLRLHNNSICKGYGAEV